LKVTVHDSIAAIAGEDWNALAGDAFPFLNHAFLELAETTGSVAPNAGLG
jgi:predicted N-acyltransferase